MSPKEAAGNLFNLAPAPLTAMTLKFLAPVLSQQFKTAPTGKPREIRNLLPEAPEPDIIDDDESKHVPFMYLWIKLKFIVITLVLVFVVSLIFPVFASNIESVNKPTISAATAGDQEVSIEKVHFSNSNIFIPVAFMMWNIGDLAGRIACGYSFFQMTNEKAMFLYSVGRVIFLPLLFMCNLDDYASALQNHSHQAIKPLVNSDVIYLFIQFLYGATNGHLCSNCFMNVGPKFTKDSEKKAAGGFTTVFLSIGLAIGSVASYLFVALIDY